MSIFGIYALQIKGILDARDLIAEALGADWSKFDKLLRSTLKQLTTAKENELGPMIDKLMDLGLGSAAKEIFREIGRKSRTDKPSEVVRLVSQPVVFSQPLTSDVTAGQLRQFSHGLLDDLDEANYVNFAFTDIDEGQELSIHEGFLSEGTYRLTVSMGLSPDKRFLGAEEQPVVERPDVDEETIELYVAVLTKTGGAISIAERLCILKWPARGPSKENAEFVLKVAPTDEERKSTLDVYIYYKTNLLYTARFAITIQHEDYEWEPDERPINWCYREKRSRLYRRFARISQLSERGLNLAIQAGDGKDEYLVTAFIDQAEWPTRVQMTREELGSNLVQMRHLMDNLRKESVYVEGGYKQDGTYTGDYVDNDSGFNKMREPVKTRKERLDVFSAFMQDMAYLGNLFYHNLFKSESGQLVRRAIEEHLKEEDIVQIWIDQDVSDFVYPWAWLYGSSNVVDPSHRHIVQKELFWGYRYIIEQLPQYPETESKLITSNEVSSTPLDIKIGVWNFPTTKIQNDFFKARSEESGDSLKYEVWDRDRMWERFLPSCDSQILYFFSHGHTAKPVTLTSQQFYDMQAKWKEWLEQPLPDESEVMKQYRQRAVESLQELERETTLLPETYIRLQYGNLLLRELEIQMNLRESAPLVFLNMCESAQVFPNISGGLIDVFLRKGARDVIGTEIPMIDSFADLFSRQFFDALFYQRDREARPSSVGKVLFDLRRKFLDMGNPLGFAYTLFGDATTRLSQSLPRTV